MAAVTVVVRAPTTMPLMLPAVADQSTPTGTVVNLTLPAATRWPSAVRLQRNRPASGPAL